MLFEWQPFQPLPITKITHDDVLLIPIARAAIAQLGERQTEDLKVPGSIPGLGIFSCCCMVAMWQAAAAAAAAAAAPPPLDPAKTSQGQGFRAFERGSAARQCDRVAKVMD